MVEKTMAGVVCFAVNFGNSDIMAIRYRPTALSRLFHFLPHVGPNEFITFDYFRRDDDYDTAVSNLSIVPVFLILALLIAVAANFLYKMLFHEDDPNNLCSCLKLKRLLNMCIAIFVLILLIMLLELIILMKLLSTHKRHTITWLSYDFQAYTDKFEEKFQPLQYGAALASVDLKDPALSQFKREFSKFATETQKILKDIKAPYQPPRYLHTDFMKHYLKFVWKRFFVCAIMWLTGLILTLCRPNRFWIVAVLGLIWCCVSAYFLMSNIVMLADICQDPDVFVIKLTNRKELKQQTMKVIQLICQQYKYLNEQNKPRLTDVYTKYAIVFDNFVNKEKELYQGKEEEYSKDIKYMYTNGVNSYLKKCIADHKDILLIDPEEYASCSKTETPDEDVPRDSIMPLCVDDAVLKWLVLQVLMVLAIAVLLIVMLMIHTTNPKVIYSGRRLVLSTKNISYRTFKKVTGEYRYYPDPDEKVEIECQETQTETIKKGSKTRSKRSKSSSSHSTGSRKRSKSSLKSSRSPEKRSKTSSGNKSDRKSLKRSKQRASSSSQEPGTPRTRPHSLDVCPQSPDRECGSPKKRSKSTKKRSKSSEEVCATPKRSFLSRRSKSPECLTPETPRQICPSPPECPMVCGTKKHHKHKHKRHKSRSGKKKGVPPECNKEEKIKPEPSECWSAPKNKPKKHHHRHKHKSHRTKSSEITAQLYSQQTPPGELPWEQGKTGKHKKHHRKHKRSAESKKDKNLFVLDIDRNLKMLVPLRHGGFCNSVQSTSNAQDELFW